MRINRIARGLLGSVVLAACLPAVAHHGQAGLFDEARTVEIVGSVKEWVFVNPHPVLVVSVTDPNGQAADWDVYFGPAAVSALQRRGFATDTFTTGETLRIKGHPATAAGARGIDVWGGDSAVTRADGRGVP